MIAVSEVDRARVYDARTHEPHDIRWEPSTGPRHRAVCRQPVPRQGAVVIRFVDLRGQDIGARFAFFNTVSDTFIDTSDGDGEGVVWNTWQELEAQIK